MKREQRLRPASVSGLIFCGRHSETIFFDDVMLGSLQAVKDLARTDKDSVDRFIHDTAKS